MRRVAAACDPMRWVVGSGVNTPGSRVAAIRRTARHCSALATRRPPRGAGALYLAEHGGAGRLLAQLAPPPPPPLFPLSGGRVLSTASSSASQPAEPEPEPTDMRVLRSLQLHPDQYVAKEGFNRAWLLPACVANHASLGAIFAWSVLNQPLLRNNGVVAPSAADWTLGDINVTFSLVMGGFLWGAVFGGY